MAVATATTPDLTDSKSGLGELGHEINHLEDVPAPASEKDLIYADEETEPELHSRTYLALVALFLLNFVQVLALTGPPAVLDYIGKELDGTAVQVWVPNALSLVQAVGGPVISFASDTFQARKTLLIGTCTVSFIGAAIAPGSKDIYRLIVAQILIGFGFAAVPLAYAIPSEILPRRWRPITLAVMNVAAALGAIIGPLVGGAFTRKSLGDGWRNFYWFQMGLWGATALGIFFGYRPPKRHTKYDHLTLWQKIGKLDLIGMALLSISVTLLLTGLTLGGNPWAWTDVRVLTTLIIGIVMLGAFGVYEWKGNSKGILHHDLFAMRTFALCASLIFIEGVLLFSIIVFYPVLTGTLFETEPLLMALRTMPFWICGGASTVVYGYWSTKRRTIRSPLFTGFAIMTAGLVGMATIKPGQSTRAIVFDGLAGLGFGSPLILIIAGVQLSTPHHLIATATAVVTSSRAVAASVFTAIYGAALGSSMKSKIPRYAAAAAIAAGLPPAYVAPFLGGILGKDDAAIAAIPEATPAVVTAALGAIANAQADSFRLVYIIAVPFGVVACIVCLFLQDLTSVMTYRVDAPIEELHARRKVADSPL